MKLWKKMLIGVGLGVVSGILLGPRAEALKPLGTVFLGLLNMLVVPLVFASMVGGVTSINDTKKLGRVGLKTVAMFAATTSLAIIIGLGFAKLFNPGVGIGLKTTNELTIGDTPELLTLILSLVPQNPLGALANGNILQILVFAIFLGMGINMAGEKGKPLAAVINSISDVMFSLTGMIMQLAPYGLFGIMAWVSGTFGAGILFPLLKLLFTHYLACIFHLVVVFGGILIFMIKVNPGKFFKGMSDAITLAATTSSSSATLPATIHCTQENLGVSRNLASFILPLGCSVNMNGTAIFQGIAAVFIAQAYGIDLSLQNLLMIVLTATLSALGCAGIPGGALVTLSIVLSSVGLPLEGVAIIAGIDRLRDIVGTVMNVLGDSVVALYVAKSEGELDMEKYNDDVYVSYEHNTAV